MRWDIPAKGKDTTHIRVAVVYRKGGDRWPRGYYASVNPIRLDGEFVICPLGRGQCATLAVVARASKKVEAAAVVQIERELEARVGRIWEMVKDVVGRNNLELGEEAN